MTGFDKTEAAKFLIESIVLELEYRHCDFTNINAAGLMESCLAQINFDKENMIDLLMTRSISENASFEISNVSTDKRCLREVKTFYINEITYEMPIALRVFNINDVIQIKIKDT